MYNLQNQSWLKLFKNLEGRGASGLRNRQHYSSGISITSSWMISPRGTPTCSTGVRLQVRPVNGLHQEREKGPPNATCMASQQGIFPHLPVSPFRRSIPWRRHKNHVSWWEEAPRRAFLPHASTNTYSWGMFLRESRAFYARKDLN